MAVYLVPMLEGESFISYQERISSIAWQFDGSPSLVVVPGMVTVNGIPPEGMVLSEIQVTPPPTPDPVSIVPLSVSRFQARAALHGAGLLETVELIMQNPETPILTRLAWEDAQEFLRYSPTVLTLAAVLNLTEAELDQLFITASQIQA